MKYSIDPYIFSKVPQVCFGIVIAEKIANSETSEEDDARLLAAETELRTKIEPDSIKTHAQLLPYRKALEAVGINANKYTNSVEAMTKRIVKGQQLPRINALVDLCNAIALTHVISLGGHDLDDIDEDLCVRLSQETDIFLPFGASEFEGMPEGEVVFTSGKTVQTRQWFWRQSELGKMTLDSNHVFFQLVGFEGQNKEALDLAMKDLVTLLEDRFNADCKSYMVTKENPKIEF